MDKKEEWLVNETIRQEGDEWRRLFKMMCIKFNLTEEELNKEKYKGVFICIERWAYYDRLRRKALKESGSKFAEDKGLFWNGE